MSWLPSSDVPFKAIFGTDKHNHILRGLLNAVLSSSKIVLKEVKVTNAEVTPALLSDKYVILDIHAVSEGQAHINIEMQLAQLAAFDQRMLYYWSRIYGSQLESGLEYRSLLPCISVLFTGFIDRELPNFHSIFGIYEQSKHIHRFRDFSAHILQLPRLASLQSKPTKELTLVERWGLFLYVESELKREEISMSDPLIQEANSIFTRISTDQEMRATQLMRDKAWANRVLHEQAMRETQKALEETQYALQQVKSAKEEAEIATEEAQKNAEEAQKNAEEAQKNVEEVQRKVIETQKMADESTLRLSLAAKALCSQNLPETQVANILHISLEELASLLAR